MHGLEALGSLVYKMLQGNTHPIPGQCRAAMSMAEDAAIDFKLADKVTIPGLSQSSAGVSHTAAIRQCS